MVKATLSFVQSELPEPHLKRTKLILAKYPELKKLFGNDPTNAPVLIGLVIIQFAAAYFLSPAPWWVTLLVSYFIGAIISHALFILIHECTHNLILRGTLSSRILAMTSNLPLLFPMAMAFRKYHLIHHRSQGEFDRDADLPGPMEAKVIGNSVVGKLLWISFFWVVYGLVRPARLKKIQLMDGWTILNFAVEIAAMSAVAYFMGWGAILYLTLSACFAIGLHPLGARWVQEHFVFSGDQETYSYYGPFNKLMFNVGYHNEHHDLMMIPGRHLPLVKATAPEFYDHLYAHTSYTKLLLKFIFDPSVSLYSRVIRPNQMTQVRTTAHAKTAKEMTPDFV